MIVQKLKKNFSSDIQRAITYYSILSVLNNLHLTKRQIELIAFTSIRGSITSPAARDEFVDMFDSSKAHLANTKGILTRKGWLVKTEGKYRVNPRIHLDFSKDICLEIKLSTEDYGVS